MTKKITQRQRDIILIILGTFLMGLSTNLFCTPENLVPGGFTGLAIIIKHVTEPFVDGGIPTWLANLILNVPLILGAIKIRGWKFVKMTFFASLIFSGWLFVIPEYDLAQGDMVLAAVFGGLLMGVGLGEVLLGRATTGGTDTLGALIQRAVPFVTVARVTAILDAAVIVLAVWIFGIHTSLYAIGAVLLSGLVSEQITVGVRNASTAFIISEKNDEIAVEIFRQLDRGATMIEATGLFTNERRPVLMCAVRKRQTVQLREIVASIDKNAFMIMMNTREVRGEGFLKYSKSEL